MRSDLLYTIPFPWLCTSREFHRTSELVSVVGSKYPFKSGHSLTRSPAYAPARTVATDIYRISDGRIAENWHIEDNLTLQQQLGLIAN